MANTSTRVTPGRIFLGGLAATFVGLIIAKTILSSAGIVAMIVGAVWLLTRSLSASQATSDGFHQRPPPMWRGHEDTSESANPTEASTPVRTAAYEVPQPPALTWLAPPNWPQPPPGWTPPQGWVPDPAWGAAPPGWQFWQPAPSTAFGYGRVDPAAAQATSGPFSPGSPPRPPSENRKWLIVAAVVGGVVLLFAAPWSDGPDYEVDNDKSLQALDTAMREENLDAPWLEDMKRVRIGFSENIDVYTSLDGQAAGSAATAVAICEAYTAASPIPGPRVMVWGEKPSLEVDGSDSRGETKLASSGGNALASAAVDDCEEITDLTDPDRSGG